MKKFVTAINCMDGRVQIPGINWLKNSYLVDYIDTVTEAGPAKILAENCEEETINSIAKQVGLSFNAHQSKLIAVVAHHDCSGNPATKEIQIEQLKKALKLVESWNFKAKVIGLWIDDKWTVGKVQ